MTRWKHRYYWRCTSVCAESGTKMCGCACKHVLQADLCKPIKFICAVWYISMKMCFTSVIEAIFKCRFNKDQRWSLASVCLLLYACVLKLQNLLIVFHLLSDKQQFSVSKWSSTITYMQPNVGGIMFSQQVPEIMEYFFFKLDITISKTVSAIAAGTSCFCSSSFPLLSTTWILSFISKRCGYIFLVIYFPSTHLRFIIISVIVKTAIKWFENPTRIWEIQKCEFINTFLSFIIFERPYHMYFPGRSPTHTYVTSCMCPVQVRHSQVFLQPDMLNL